MNKFISEKFKQYWGLVTYTVILAYLIFNIPSIINGGISIIEVISPFILGIAIAFVLNLLMVIFENKVLKFLDNKRYLKIRKAKRGIAITLTFFTVILVFIGLIRFIIPQLIDSVAEVENRIPGYIKSFEETISGYGLETEFFGEIWNNILNAWEEIFEIAGNVLVSSLTSILDMTISITSGLINFVLAIVFSIYMLSSKEKLQLQMRKVVYVMFNKNIGDKIVYVGRVANKSFASFIGGQCIEAVIIGVLCFIGMIILDMPYAVLVSVLVGITAIIPIFGAFIGTIPSAFIILIVDPTKALWFIVFIIILQQIEGNLIYPKVVGESVGLPAMWVMLAMTVGGSTLGLLGMLLGIPVFSTIYKLSSEIINYNLEKKKLEID